MKQFTTPFGLILTGLVCGVVLSVALGSARARTWTPNAATAPQNNAESLLHVGAEDQEKGTGSACDIAGSACGLAVGSFLAAKNAAFDGDAFFHQLITGKSDTVGSPVSMLSFGNATAAVTLSLSGSGAVTGGGLYSDKIATSGGAMPLCADKSGNIILCSGGTPQPTMQRISGKIVSWCTDFYSGRDWHSGTEHLRIDFDQPLPVAVSLKFAKCENNQYAIGSVGQNTCQGTLGFVSPLPSGYIGSNGPATLNIAPGTASYVVPATYSCSNNGNKSNTKTSYTDYFYFKQVSPDATKAQFSFTGTGYSANLNTSYGTGFPMTITQIP